MGFAKLGGMTPVAEYHEALDPLHVLLFCTNAVMQHANARAHLIEQASHRLRRFVRIHSPPPRFSIAAERNLHPHFCARSAEIRSDPERSDAERNRDGD
jgi:hypothetical protein